MKRKMIRRYTPQAVSDELITALLNAAITAPSPHNRQPWRFAVLTGNVREKLALAMGDKLRRDRLNDGDPIEVIEKDVSRSHDRIISAPVNILVCLSMIEMDTYPDQRRKFAETWMAGQAVACAVQNMLLCAAELDLGACWMCAPLFCQSDVVQALDLPEDWQPQALITIGYPADDGRDRPRKLLDEVTVWLS
jgi:F420 biosynthesis protein FbiB-like protein